MKGFRRALLTAATVTAAALVAATAAVAAGSNAAAYRAQVNAICRSYTPLFRRLESEMATAKRAGDNRRYAYDVGVALALTLKETVRVEKAPVPADAKERMAGPLRLLHTVEIELRRTIVTAVNGDAAGFAIESKKLAKVAAPLNRAFDAVGLRDCGSNQN